MLRLVREAGAFLVECENNKEGPEASRLRAANLTARLLHMLMPFRVYSLP
jgi:hypothetical protein